MKIILKDEDEDIPYVSNSQAYDRVHTFDRAGITPGHTCNKTYLLNFQLLRIRDVCLGPQFFHPGSRIKKIPDPGFGSASKNLSTFNQKIKTCFLALGILIGDVHPGSGFFPISDPGSGSATLSVNNLSL